MTGKGNLGKVVSPLVQGFCHGCRAVENSFEPKRGYDMSDSNASELPSRAAPTNGNQSLKRVILMQRSNKNAGI